jgi:hypothetical protein
MLFPITYKEISGEDRTIYIDPESIVDIEDPTRDGELTGVLNIWTAGGKQSPITIMMSIVVLSGIIEDIYDTKLHKKCPFMYVAGNLYVNACYICAIEPGPINKDDSVVSLSGSVVGFTIPGRPAEETMKQVNAVLESL